MGSFQIFTTDKNKTVIELSLSEVTKICSSAIVNELGFAINDSSLLKYRKIKHE